MTADILTFDPPAPFEVSHREAEQICRMLTDRVCPRCKGYWVTAVKTAAQGKARVEARCSWCKQNVVIPKALEQLATPAKPEAFGDQDFTSFGGGSR